MFKLGKKQEWESKYQLQQNFQGYIKLKPLQKAIINCNIKNDVLVNLPTGFGKSLLFQYPAFHSQKITIVFVPLRALLQDSILQAQKLKLQAEEIIDTDVLEKCLSKTCKIKILFLTPQKLSIGRGIFQGIQQLVCQNRVDKFVIDEAHCISEWGNDFRPAYGELSQLKSRFPQVRILAMTATAPPRIRNQIIQKLKIQNSFFFQFTYNRVNLFYQVRTIAKKELFNQISQILDEYRGQCGIIYCQTIKLAEELYKQIRGHNIQVFHSKISQNKRFQILKKFKNDQCKILIATICFGMGVNKPNVRFIIHAGMSLTIQNYYQQSGRSGRDGEPSKCILIHFEGEQRTLNYLIEKSGNRNLKKLKYEQLASMMDYVQNNQNCRRTVMFKYLGEQFPKSICDKKCDNCNKKQSKWIEIDFTEKGKKIIEMMKEYKYFFTKNQLISYLKGQKIKKFEKNNKSQLFALLKSENQKEIKFYVDSLLKEKYLLTFIKSSKYGPHTYIKINGQKKIKKDDKIILKKQQKQQKRVSLATSSKIESFLKNKLKKQNKYYKQDKQDKNEKQINQIQLKQNYFDQYEEGIIAPEQIIINNIITYDDIGLQQQNYESYDDDHQSFDKQWSLDDKINYEEMFDKYKRASSKDNLEIKHINNLIQQNSKTQEINKKQSIQRKGQKINQNIKSNINNDNIQNKQIIKPAKIDINEVIKKYYRIEQVEKRSAEIFYYKQQSNQASQNNKIKVQKSDLKKQIKKKYDLWK